MSASPSQTHYDVLGISRDADATEVRRAWKTLVQVWHPDRFTGDMVDEAQERAAQINDAYSTLRDSGRRAAYDCRLAGDDLVRESKAAAAAEAARAARRSSAGRAARVSPSSGHEGVTIAAMPLDQQLLAAVGDAIAAMRRHPRASLATAAACVLAFGGIAAFNVMTGPSLPSGSSIGHVRRAVASTDDTSLEDLAAQSHRAADAANEQLAQQLQADAAAEAAAHAQPPALAAPEAPPVTEPAQPTVKGGGKVQEIVKPDGTHVLRIMPG